MRQRHNNMKTKPKQTCAYLYADGHAVIIYEQTVKLGGSTAEMEYAVIHEKFTNAHLGFTGRIAFSRYGSSAMMDLAKRAARINAHEQSVESGSDNSKRLGVAIGSLMFDFPGNTYLQFHDTSIISGQYKYQPENGEKFDPEATHYWGNIKVTEIIREKKAQVTA